MEALEFKKRIQEDNSDDIYKEMSIWNLREHYIRANKEFE